MAEKTPKNVIGLLLVIRLLRWAGVLGLVQSQLWHYCFCAMRVPIDHGAFSPGGRAAAQREIRPSIQRSAHLFFGIGNR